METRHTLRYGAGVCALVLGFGLASCRLSAASSAASDSDEAPKDKILELERDIEFGPGPLNLPDVRVGLPDLSTYKSALTISFEGTQAGQAARWSSTYLYLSSKEPAAHQLTVESSGDTSEPGSQYWAEQAGAAYARRGDEACMATIIDPENSFTRHLEPAALLTGVLGAEEAGREQVGGLQADHYTFDERALAQGGLNDSTGELWVASEAGYVLRYRLTTTADAGYFGDGTAGTLAWDYQLMDINAPVSIELPGDCPEGLVDAPMLDDAAKAESWPGVLAYETGRSVAEVRAFYEQELPKLGWSAPEAGLSGLPEGMTQEEYQQALEMLKGLGLGQPAPTPDPNPAVVSFAFTQLDQTLSVNITRGEAGTKVALVLTKAIE